MADTSDANANPVGRADAGRADAARADPADATPRARPNTGRPPAAIAPPATDPTVHYAEDGWSWGWLAAAPAGCTAAGVFEWLTGAPVHWLMLTVCALATAACHAVIIAATRIHGRVRLTDTTFWQGTEELPLDLVAGVLDTPDEGARLLGELREVPRRRGEVGLALHSQSTVRAYARHPQALAAALTERVGRALSPNAPTPPPPAHPPLPDDGEPDNAS